jgi:hypothetical protein
MQVGRSGTKLPSMQSAVRPESPLPDIEFPCSDPESDSGQSTIHYDLCRILYQVLTKAVGGTSFVAIDLFFFYDPSNDKKKCTPDALVKLGCPPDLKDAWYTWKDGIPELCIEILYRNDRDPLAVAEMLDRYRAIGVREFITYDPLAPPGERLRAWDRRDDALVERTVIHERTECRSVGMWFVLASSIDAPHLSCALRLARDPQGTDLVLTPRELAHALEEANARRQSAETQAQAIEAQGQEAEAQRQEALAEVERLRALLAKHSP